MEQKVDLLTTIQSPPCTRCAAGPLPVVLVLEGWVGACLPGQHWRQSRCFPKTEVSITML